MSVEAVRIKGAKHLVWSVRIDDVEYARAISLPIAQRIMGALADQEGMKERILAILDLPKENRT